MVVYKCLHKAAFFLVLVLCFMSLGQAEGVGANISQKSLPDFTALARQEGSAIVNISSQQSGESRMSRSLTGRDLSASLQDFLRRFGVTERDSYRYSRTQGSGFIIDREGHILTSAHLVEEADEIIVGLSDKRQFPARMIGLDKNTDIALLKIEPADLPFVRIGDPGTLEVGEWVVAIGAPFGFTSTVTQGIVSAKGRELPGGGTTPFIQTDVAINPGNSGGPLFNMRGEVVGINSQIFSHSGGYMGISFAIPIDVAFRIKDELLRHGSIRRARLGVLMQEVTSELAASFTLPKLGGALISALEKGGPAQSAGLQPGDILLEFNHQAITGISELARMVADSTPGASIQIKFWRDGSARELRLRLGEVAGPEKPVLPTRLAIEGLGLMLLEIDPEDRQMMGTEAFVMIEAVDGIAARAGFQPGDMILAVNGKPVSNLVDIQRDLSSGRRHVALLIERDANTRMFLPLRIE